MHFKYTAINIKTGTRKTAVVQVDTAAELMLDLKNQGFLPEKIEEVGNLATKFNAIPFFQTGRVSRRELTVFTRQISATLNAGLLLTESLDAVMDGMTNAFFRRIIIRIREQVNGGEEFSYTLQRYPNIFSPTYLAVIRTGEATGRLGEMMAGLAKYLEDAERLAQKVKTAVRYPLFIVGFAFLVVGVIVVFLIPQFASLFSEFGATLPFLTRIMMGVSDAVLHNGPAVLLAAILILVVSWLLMKNYQFRRIIDAAKIRIPILGRPVIHKALIARFCRTFGILLDAGVNLDQALEICAQVGNHTLLSEATHRIKERVVAGASISQELKNEKIFPGLVSRMAGAGERSGQLADMLKRVAQYYEEELETSLANLTSTLEPFLIVVVGGFVLLVVVALYLPIFTLTTIIR